MEAQPKRSRTYFIPLHIFHVCLSIGLIVAVVHNQLVNDARFEKLESKCDCKLSNDETSVNAKSIKQDNDYSNAGKSEFGPDVQTKPRSIVRRTSAVELNPSLGNYTNHTEPSGNNKSASIGRMTNETLPGNEAIAEDNKTKTTHENVTEMYKSSLIQENVNKTKEMQNRFNKFSEMNQSSIVGQTDPPLTKTTTKNTTSQFLEGQLDLISCLDELKVIIDDYLQSGRPLRGSKGCQLLQGSKEEAGAKGERGEKGCSGTSFAPPSFYSSPKNFVLKEGETATLSCNATANPSAQITWYRDSNMITGERDNTSYRIVNRDITPLGLLRAQLFCPSELPHPVIQSTLLIKNLSGLDTGTYTCQAHNFMGASSYEIPILVQEYVHYTALPANATVVQGENLQLRCPASGVPTPTITWYRKDGGSMPSHYSVDKGDLHILNISKEEEGTFVCLATNVLGPKTTEATVTVNVFPKFVFFQEKPLTVNESDNLLLPCSSKGYPSPAIHWSKTNDTLPTGRYFYDSQTLNVLSVQYEDRGEYVCTANNTVGAIANKVTVIVQVAPKITKRPKTTEYGFKGKTKVLEFGAFAIPDAKIVWRKPYYGEVSGRFRQENGSLVIDNVQYTDSGLYQAVARNILGEVRITTFLVVRDAVPAAIRSAHLRPLVSLIEGRNLSETCFAVGIPTPQITWKHNDNTTVASATSFSLNLNIINVTSRDAGRYTCVASNEFGFEQQQHFELKVISRWIKVRIQGSYYARRMYRTISHSSGELKSSRYQENYGQNLHYKYKLTSNTRIVVKFVRFSTESCCDKVKIYDGDSSSSPSLGEFSGERLPPTITSSSNQLYITFITDGAKQQSGFIAICSAIV